MKNPLHGKRSVLEFFRGKGVYVALAAGVIALGGVGAVITGSMSKHPEAEPESSSPEEPAEQIMTGQTAVRPTASPTETPTKPKPTASQPPELYVFPLSNTVQKPFSVDKPLFSETLRDWRIHPGTDFAGTIGQAVKAVAAGTVTAVEEDALWGPCLVIDHGVGVVSRYCGVKAAVKKGDKVRLGDKIGTLADIPCENGQSPHLHLEMTVDGHPADPVSAIGKPVRYAQQIEE